MLGKRLILVSLLFISTNVFAIEPGIKGHNRGDIIAVRKDSEIAAWCDFNKQIVSGQNILCVYNGNNTKTND